MKNKLSVFFLLFSLFGYSQVPHCGFDFTSYLVVIPHEKSNTAVINDLQITIVDEDGKEVLNTDNSLSWVNKDKALLFDRNYLISKPTDKERWFFPYATESYFLSVTNTFPADNYNVKITDLKGVYKTQTIPLQNFNMYILCSSENEKQSRQFGPRTNRPIEVVMEKN
ncbi:hypothetical protein [Flavobacterium sp.]|jgi:hypothetical protein|uniref:hypothetical protein n=1 Tax=Flavobacterium sp. TaxID=239 RepID=UPI002A80FBA7|nr:hypothetical protein [Flavobacterium sp.]